ncbi:MAG: DUF427 domain-containing protein [Actinomycetota bacterium]|nr:DUF427 domain-containing protein [Actinomycetota bacterium]
MAAIDQSPVAVGRADAPPGYPQMIVGVNHIEPVPRRLRAVLAGTVVLDTTSALYVWEWPNYPQYYIPLADVRKQVRVDEQHEQRLSRGTARQHGLRVGDVSRANASRIYGADALPGLAGTARFDWDALDAWYEEDEQVFVHPRNPYTRVDALRSTRSVRIELDGVVLAESRSPVLVFETGLPTRYYVNRNEINLARLVPTDTVTACPYKGSTSCYWSAHLDDASFRDVAWSYDFPTRELLPIAGLVAFYNESVDLYLDDTPVGRPATGGTR